MPPPSVRGPRKGRRILIALLVVCTASVFTAVAWRFRFDIFPSDVRKGLSAYQTGDYRQAHAFAIKSLRQTPGDRESLRLMARASARLGWRESAQSVYAKLGDGSMGGEDFYLIARWMLESDDVKSARGLLEKALERDSVHPEALNALIWLEAGYYKDLSGAIELAKRLSRIKGREIEGNVLLGITSAEFQDYDQSVKALSLALSMDPEGVRFPVLGSPVAIAKSSAKPSPLEIRKQLIRSLLHMGRVNEALDQIQQAARGNPSDSELGLLESRAYLQKGDGAAALAAFDRTKLSAEPENPMALEPSPFAGASACQPCHNDIYRSQQEKSRHAKTLSSGDFLEVIDPPTSPMVDPFNQKLVHKFSRQGNKLVIETSEKDGRAILKAFADYALGSGAKGATLVGVDQDGLMRELRLSHYSAIHGWDLTTGQTETPSTKADFAGKPLNGDQVRRCLNCHSTNGAAILASKGAERFDHAIGCERCHGPGVNHVKAVETHFPALAISRPNLATAKARLELCAQCHSPSGLLEPEGFDPTEIKFVRNQTSTLRKSRCFTESNDQLDCTTCHNPHKNAETRTEYYVDKCLSCHGPDRKDGASAARCPVNSKNDCIKCHMPQVKADMRHSTFTDHYIRIHREPIAKRVGD